MGRELSEAEEQRRSATFHEIYEALGDALEPYGTDGPDDDDAYWIFSDDYGGFETVVYVVNLALFSTEAVSKIQGLLVRFPADWRVNLQLSTSCFPQNEKQLRELAHANGLIGVEVWVDCVLHYWNRDAVARVLPALPRLDLPGPPTTSKLPRHQMMLAKRDALEAITQEARAAGQLKAWNEAILTFDAHDDDGIYVDLCLMKLALLTDGLIKRIQQAIAKSGRDWDMRIRLGLDPDQSIEKLADRALREGLSHEAALASFVPNRHNGSGIIILANKIIEFWDRAGLERDFPGTFKVTTRGEVRSWPPAKSP